MSMSSASMDFWRFKMNVALDTGIFNLNVSGFPFAEDQAILFRLHDITV
jgi:hypothetical protein